MTWLAQAFPSSNPFPLLSADGAELVKRQTRGDGIATVALYAWPDDGFWLARTEVPWDIELEMHQWRQGMNVAYLGECRSECERQFSVMLNQLDEFIAARSRDTATEGTDA